MPINDNTELANKHVLVVACSGSGKSQVLANHILPKKNPNARVLLWDPDEDHTANERHATRLGFVDAVVKLLKSKKKKYRIAYTGGSGVQDFEWFCALVWKVLDGIKILHIVIEELADVSPSAAKASPHFGTLIRRARKYGGILYLTTQRGTEISKTCFTQCQFKVIGQQEGPDIKTMAGYAVVSVNEIMELGKLEFWVKAQGADPAQKLKIKYKKVV